MRSFICVSWRKRCLSFLSVKSLRMTGYNYFEKASSPVALGFILPLTLCAALYSVGKHDMCRVRWGKKLCCILWHILIAMPVPDRMQHINYSKGRQRFVSLINSPIGKHNTKTCSFCPQRKFWLKTSTGCLMWYLLGCESAGQGSCTTHWLSTLESPQAADMSVTSLMISGSQDGKDTIIWCASVFCNFFHSTQIQDHIISKIMFILFFYKHFGSMCTYFRRVPLSYHIPPALDQAPDAALCGTHFGASVPHKWPRHKKK